MNRQLMKVLVSAVLLVASGSVLGQQNWTGNESDDWFDAANWSGAVPTSATNSVRINTVNPNPAVIEGAAAETGSSFSVGHTSRGELRILNGGSLVSGTSAAIGSQSAGDGRVLIGGGGSIWQVQSISIGSFGAAEVEIEDGGRMHVLGSGVTSFGQSNVNASASITISGPESRLDIEGRFWLGHLGSGAMTITDGAQVTWAGTGSNLAQAGNSQGELLLIGTGSLLEGSRLLVGNGDTSGTNLASAYLRLGDGAMLRITGPGSPPNHRVVIASNSRSEGEMVIGGPSGEAPEPPGQMELDGGILFSNGAGTLVFNHAGELDLPFPIEGPNNGTAHIRVENGTTLFSGQPFDYSGSLQIDAGAVFGAGGQLGDVVNEGRLVASPGRTATLTIAGDYAHGQDAVLEIQFEPGVTADLVEVDGEATFAGGAIDFLVLPGDYGQTPLDGTYPILTASGGISGDLPALQVANPNAFELVQDGNSLSVIVSDQMHRDRFED